MKRDDDKVSPYTILNRWLYDGNKKSNLPEDLKNDKVIPQTIILYHFLQSKYIIFLSKVFNNFYLYQLDRSEVFKCLKECVYTTGFKPKFLHKPQTEKNKLQKILKLRFPYLKSYEVETLVQHIDNSEDKDMVYETFGLYTPKKKKTTKEDLKRINEISVSVGPIKNYTLNRLMENFSNV